LIVGIFAFATFSLGMLREQRPSFSLVRTSPSSASYRAYRPGIAVRASMAARNLARLPHAQNEIAPSAKLRQGALPFGRTRCG
jgi:hypothetical protein